MFFLQKNSEHASIDRSKRDQPHIVKNMLFARLVEEMEEELKKKPARSKVISKLVFVIMECFQAIRRRNNINNKNTSTRTILEGESSQDVLTRALLKPEKTGREICNRMLPPSNDRCRV
ncbi:hypothetical protein ACFE04_010190 [Oxalis oulophora]